jgi:hypothetical protein
VKKLQEDATIAMRVELERAMAEPDSVDTELNSKFSILLCQLSIHLTL